MGITTAQFTLAAGIMSFVGGDLMSLDFRTPFYISFGAALLTLVLLAVAWNRPDIKRVTS